MSGATPTYMVIAVAPGKSIQAGVPGSGATGELYPTADAARENASFGQGVAGRTTFCPVTQFKTFLPGAHLTVERDEGQRLIALGMATFVSFTMDDSALVY